MSLGMDSIKALACPFINHRSLSDANTAGRGVVANFCPARQTAAFWRDIVFPNPDLHQIFERLLSVSDRTGEFVAVNVKTCGKVLALTGVWPRIRRIDYRSAQIWFVNPCY